MSSTTTIPQDGQTLPRANAEIEAAFHAEWIERVGRPRWRLWFRDVAVSGFDGETVDLCVPSDLHRAWMEVAYGPVVEATAARILGAGVRVRVRPSAGMAARSALRLRLPDTAAAWTTLLERLRPAPTLASFVPGNASRFAHAVLERVAAGGPPPAGSLALLVGARGTGKSHLLAAVEAERARVAPGSTLRLDAEAFTTRFVSTVRARDEAARRAFAHTVLDRDLVLIDDADRLAGRPATQEELARLLDHSTGGRPAWILALAARPTVAAGWSPRLVSRFDAGAVLPLDVADEERRRAVLERRATGFGLVLPADVAAALAAGSGSLASAVDHLDRWAAASRQMGRPLEVGELSEVAPGLARAPGDEVVRRVKHAVAGHFGLPAVDLERPTKARHAAWPRQVALYLAYRASAMPLARLGAAFGWRSHSSASRALAEMRRRRDADPSVEALLDGLLAAL